MLVFVVVHVSGARSCCDAEENPRQRTPASALKDEGLYAYPTYVA